MPQVWPQSTKDKGGCLQEQNQNNQPRARGLCPCQLAEHVQLAAD